MKYVITESQINKFVSKYLDSQDWYTWDVGDDEFDITDRQYGRNEIMYRIQYSSTVPDHSFEVLYIQDKLVTKIGKLFGLDNPSAIDSIIHWFNEKYSKNLNRDNFEWIDDDGEYDDEENF